MTLPPRIAKQPKRATRWRSQAHCSYIRSHHCSIAGCMDMPIEVAHVRLGSGAGIGQKPDDWNAISLCGGPNGHHAEQHRIGEQSFAMKYQINLQEIARRFSTNSPKSAEIRRIRNERGLA